MDDRSMETISKMLSEMKFKKTLFGGVDEKDVWKKLEALQNEYKRLYELQAEKYEAIIDYLKQEGKNHDQK